MQIINQVGESAQDVARRFAQLAAVKMLESETGLDQQTLDEDERTVISHSESKDTLLLSSKQKKDAKSRAQIRLEEVEKQLVIAKSNYIQLGGRLEDITVKNVEIGEHHTIK